MEDWRLIEEFEKKFYEKIEKEERIHGIHMMSDSKIHEKKDNKYLYHYYVKFKYDTRFRFIILFVFEKPNYEFEIVFGIEKFDKTGSKRPIYKNEEQEILERGEKILSSFYQYIVNEVREYYKTIPQLRIQSILQETKTYEEIKKEIRFL